MLQQTSNFWENTRFRDVWVILFFIFSIKFIFLPVDTTRLVLLVCFIMLVVFRREVIHFPFNKKTFRSFLLLLLYGVYTAIITVYSGGSNISNLANIILIFFQIAFGSYILAAYFIKIDLDQLFFLLLVIFGIQGFLIFLNFIIPPYRELMFTLMPPGGNIDQENFTSAFRTRGLMQSSGATVSSFISIGLLMGAYFLTSFNLSKTDRRVVLLCLPLILVGIVFTGRTGFIMVPLAFFFYYVLLYINRKLTLKSLLPLLLFPLGSVAVYLLIRFSYLAIFPDGAPLIELWERWAFESFLENFNADSEKTSTLDKLASWFFVPESDRHFLFGDPTTWGVIRTDLGYIRMLFAVGIIGSLLFYGGFIQLFAHLVRYARSFTQQCLLLAILLWILIVEYKEPMFLHNYFNTTIMLMVFFNMKSVPK